MRVTSDLWVSAAVRRAFSSGGFAAVERRGAAEAGAILILRRDRMGRTTLYGPAPQTSYDEASPEGRIFSEWMTSDDPEAIETRIGKELRFDSDLWVVELEVDAALFEELVPVRA